MATVTGNGESFLFEEGVSKFAAWWTLCDWKINAQNTFSHTGEATG